MVYARLGRINIPVEVEAIAPLLQQFHILVFIASLFVLIAALPILFQPEQRKSNWVALILICGFAVGFRWSQLEATPWLTNDVYRYLWDAQVLDHGINPYAYAPQAPELTALQHTEAYAKMDHRHVHTVTGIQIEGAAPGREGLPIFQIAMRAGVKIL